MKSTEKKAREYDAIFTVYGLGNMNKREAQRVTKWLRSVADGIEKEGAKKYRTGRFCARLMKRS